MKEYIVATAMGEISGTLEEDTLVFRGVPYAEPPVGDLRFRRPVPKKTWSGVKPTKTFSPKAHQADLSLDPFYGKEFYAGPSVPMSEDCLYLNIWTPRDAVGRNLPVLLWIHGGAFMHGCSSEIEFDGMGFAKRDVIFVSINYRVGALGFFAHPTLTAEDQDGACGNYGLWDQIAALQWVQENIAAFGGNPQAVTIAGQSAGCMSVQCLCSTAHTKGLFRGAILQSGGGIPGLSMEWTVTQQQEVSQKLMETLGISTLAQLRAQSPEAITQAGYAVFATVGHLCWQPCSDGFLLTASPAALALAGKMHDISYLIGSTKNDMGEEVATLLQESAVHFAENQKALGRTSPYLYYFAHALPGDHAGAFHSCELWYEFQTLSRCWRPFTPEDHVISAALSSHFAAFVAQGNPNTPSAPLWDPAPMRMVYGEEIKQEKI